ncbi:hypothetical protein A0H81_06361 [Grifola frondosa]|uniref:CID domain-containing protein n=1 Tax=Grifola frondosa TaxID=5627 RepID=A0A1C7MA48_GRIFR|nr:hypothetical protein A0H81_06361 [Grifola frondosa]
MATLTDYALKSMENDTELVLILYRTHKKLKNRTAKVSSLYVFDALSRAARNQVNKRGLTADGGSTQGNCATFLLKVEGILDGLFGDMVSSGNTELKVSLRVLLLTPGVYAIRPSGSP